MAEQPGAARSDRSIGASARAGPCHCAAPLLESRPPAQAQHIPGYVSTALLQARLLLQGGAEHRETLRRGVERA